jgi:D-alanyl-D-alanine carboxypeptidase/D-alanyl-D-alanine-endopeptidase (penicillin-binding protein 4)
VQVEPRHHGLPEDIGVTTLAKGKLIVRLGALGARGVQVQGQIPASVRRWSGSFAHPDPVELFGSVLRGALSDAGIRVRGALRREPGAAGGTELCRLRTPLVSTLRPINTDSENGVADQLFLALGHAATGAGTRAGAAAATRRAVERLGVPAAGLVQVDGSGLSRDNRATARQISALIAAVLDLGDPTATLFRESLAVAGESGTLDQRMTGPQVRGKVQAKTGFIGGVSALSGLARSDAGAQYVFSILVEYPPYGGLNTSCWKKMQDEICGLLVGLEP